MSTNAWDAAGAAHFGFNVAWLNRFNKIQEVLPGRPKMVITTLVDLMELVGARIMNTMPRSDIAPPVFADVQAAAERLSGRAIRTPLLENVQLNERCGGRVLIKAETLQRTGSFNFAALITCSARFRRPIRQPA